MESCLLTGEFAYEEYFMSDEDIVPFDSSNWEEFVRTINPTITRLPTAVQSAVLEILKKYYGWYGVEGTFNRLNRRTFKQIVSEFTPIDRKPIAQGEVDGIQYELHAGASESTDDVSLNGDHSS